MVTNLKVLSDLTGTVAAPLSIVTLAPVVLLPVMISLPLLITALEMVTFADAPAAPTTVASAVVISSFEIFMAVSSNC
jgi:hypothetical protein